MTQSSTVRTAGSQLPVTFNASGGYPRTCSMPDGHVVLATSAGGSPTASCNLFLTRNESLVGPQWDWEPLLGPKWAAPPGTDLSNCAPGLAPDGRLVVGVRHHNGAEGQPIRGARPQRWNTDSVFRIQVVKRQDDFSWEGPTTPYATIDREYAAWEPVFSTSLDGTVLRVAYSLERPADWVPPQCEPGTDYPGADLGFAFTASSAYFCQGLCAGEARCVAWSWRRSGFVCSLKASGHGKATDSDVESGAKLCGAGCGASRLCGVDLVEVNAEANAEVEVDGWKRSPPQAGPPPREQDIVWQESADSGKTWGPVVVLSRTEGSRDGMPSVVRQLDGCLTIVHEGFASGATSGDFIVSAIRSCDDGSTWSKQPVTRQDSTRHDPNAHAPTIALLPDGRGIVASYDDAFDIQLQATTRPLRSNDQPLWEAPSVVYPSPGFEPWPNIFSSPVDGMMWLAYNGQGGKAMVSPLGSFAVGEVL